ncbi:MAG: N(4)-(beta-N-acetylglucosaminyl)-L-asparaginase [Gemmatimonadota bacterium]|jgi:N4-(beta-N-acetylglucosaminyl)-L-asparaginase
MSDRERDPSFDRRAFIRSSVALGAGAAALGRFPRMASARPVVRAGTPFIITSHTNETGQEAMRQAWQILADGGKAMDAVERGANVIEVDPEDTSVGYGGLPDANGVVQLDASCMDGRTYNAGSVAALENIKTPSSVARLVMERTDHVMLVGVGALEFAKSFGFKEENLLTEKARKIWVRWREQLSDSDDWGPPDHLRGRGDGGGADAGMRGPVESHHGTTNVLAVDRNGDVAGITTTSGLSWKIPGRVGDSPIIGAGLYVDNSVGAAGATGRGEDVIKSCASYYIVMRMRDGRSPQEACEDAIEMIVDRYRAIGNDYVPGEKFVAINKAGEVGCASMGYRGGPPGLTHHTAEGLTGYTGRALYVPQG